MIKPPTQQQAADLVLVWSWNNREGKHWPLAVAELVSVLQTLFQSCRHAQLGTERGPRTVDMRAEVWRWMATINYLAAQPPVTTTSKLYLHHWGSRLQHLILLYFGALCKVYSWDFRILSFTETLICDLTVWLEALTVPTASADTWVWHTLLTPNGTSECYIYLFIMIYVWAGFLRVQQSKPSIYLR